MRSVGVNVWEFSLQTCELSGRIMKKLDLITLCGIMFMWMA